MPRMKSRRTLAPKLGGGSIWSSAMSITSLTASTIRPSSTRSPSRIASKITMQVFLPTSAHARPKRACRSITGTTAPRRLITPRTKPGISGTVVSVPYWMISRTVRMSIANTSSPSVKVRYWAGVSSTSALAA